MDFNFIVMGVMFLLYFPLFFLAALSWEFRRDFMRVHSVSWVDYVFEVFAGVVYFGIFVIGGVSSFSGDLILLVLGALLYSIGLVFTLGGYYAFLKGVGDSCISRWPYSVSRHPTYFFGLVGLLGISLVLGSVIMILLVMLEFVLTHRIVLQEEKYCTKTYGKSYLKYMKRVRRYM
ncbi:MAG: protein-S-isoprenylcysteine O-methyltransferase Ste14 [Patescibacteria group bacterium]|jgi:protein-S-isoprenylcysteine O-methyltransferase Ste14